MIAAIVAWLFGIVALGLAIANKDSDLFWVCIVVSISFQFLSAVYTRRA